jgi:flagellar basal-body rod protein FlgB
MLQSVGGATLELRKTNSGHISHGKSSRAFREEKQKETYETSLDGNAVVIEEQLMKVSETQGHYRLATNLYRKHITMIKAALGRDR